MQPTENNSSTTPKAKKKEKNIFLIRHGESTANLNQMRYALDMDFNVPITEFGREQAVRAGKALNEFFTQHPELKGKKIRVYYSPYLRTRQTKDGLIEGAGKLLSKENGNVQFREDTLLRERDWGVFTHLRDPEKRKSHYPNESAYSSALKEKKGGIYAPIPSGESMVQATHRMEIFKDKMMGSLERNDIDVAIVIGHTDILTCFEKAFFHHDVEWLTNHQNTFKNGDIKLLQNQNGKPYKSKIIYHNEQRSPHLPKDYKTEPYGVEKEAAISA